MYIEIICKINKKATYTAIVLKKRTNQKNQITFIVTLHVNTFMIQNDTITFVIIRISNLAFCNLHWCYQQNTV